MAEKDRVHPLAPADDHEAKSTESKLLRRRKLYIKCCGCLTVLLLIPIVVIIVVFIAFQVKHPVIRMNSVSMQQQLEIVNGSTALRDENITVLVDVSVKNPNYASFKYGNATTVVYYCGMVVGDGCFPAGLAKARRTLRMNFTVHIVPKKVLSAQTLSGQNLSDPLNMSSCTRIDGKVNMFNIVKKNVAVQLNCTFTYDISSNVIQNNCRHHVHL